MDQVAVGAGGDGTAWDGLEEMRDGLRAFLVRHCTDENDIEDVIQETFLRAARYRRRRVVQCLRPWAMRIALNVLADARRRVVRTQAQTGDEAFDPPEIVEPEPGTDCAYRVGEQWLDGESARELVLRTLGGMERRDRGLLDSFYGGTSSTALAALECDIPQRLVKVRLYRARQRLLRALRQRVLRERRWAQLAS